LLVISSAITAAASVWKTDLKAGYECP